MIAAGFLAASALVIGAVGWIAVTERRNDAVGMRLRHGFFRSRGEIKGVSFVIFWTWSGNTRHALTFESFEKGLADLDLYIAGPWPPDRPVFAYAAGWEELASPHEGRKAWGRPAAKAAAAALKVPFHSDYRRWNRLEVRGGRVRADYGLDRGLNAGEVARMAKDFNELLGALRAGSRP